MAIKKRVIKNLELTENNFTQSLKTRDRCYLEAAIEALAAAKELCKKGLKSENYKVREEFYNGLFLTFETLVNSEASEELAMLAFAFINYLRKEMEREENFKKEIVFLPTQAAMWDSLESVWKEAYNDENVLTYVIPVPYASLSPDQNMENWHIDKWYLDADKFPSYVPVVYFSDIDLKELHPEVIFFNNPYDGYNRTSVVDERYYSDKLKEYTDKLVYIPYFILQEPVSEEGIEHLVLKPGVSNADLVVTQSETVREIYVNILSKKTDITDKGYWEKKIISAGSPKVDKVILSEKKDFDLPKSWQKIIRGKKIILYNTSVAPALENADRICEKLESVFKLLKNHKDVVLWWRPHPLMKQSLHSMYPQVEKKYLELEREFIEKQYGIYDDTGDLHRAICYSDAYYGDFSSVATLYSYTGKPIMIQNMFFDADDDLRVGFEDVCVDEIDNNKL